MVLSNRCGIHCKYGNKQGRFDSINFPKGCRLIKLGAIEPLRFPKMRSAKGGSTAPNFIQGIYKLYIVHHIHGVFYKVLYKVFQVVFFLAYIAYIIFIGGIR